MSDDEMLFTPHQEGKGFTMPNSAPRCATCRYFDDKNHPSGYGFCNAILDCSDTEATAYVEAMWDQPDANLRVAPEFGCVLHKPTGGDA